MNKIPSLGQQEMDLLKYVAEHSPISVRNVSSYFEEEKNLARTTVLTVMERLRKKGLLARAKVDGVFHYSAKFETEVVLRSKVSQFIEKTLGGSISPLLTYFMDSESLSDLELQQLKEMAEKLSRKGGGQS